MKAIKTQTCAIKLLLHGLCVLAELFSELVLHNFFYFGWHIQSAVRLQLGRPLIQVQMGSKSGKKTHAAVISLHRCSPPSLPTPSTTDAVERWGQAAGITVLMAGLVLTSLLLRTLPPTPLLFSRSWLYILALTTSWFDLCSPSLLAADCRSCWKYVQTTALLIC